MRISVDNRITTPTLGQHPVASRAVFSSTMKAVQMACERLDDSGFSRLIEVIRCRFYQDPDKEPILEVKVIARVLTKRHPIDVSRDSAETFSLAEIETRVADYIPAVAGRLIEEIRARCNALGSEIDETTPT